MPSSIQIAVLSTIFAITSSPTFAQRAEPEQLDGQPLLRVQGTLEEGDEILHDGTLYDVHEFRGRAGQAINISLQSTDFDAYLILENSEGHREGHNDNLNGDSHNASISLILPEDDTYRILANTKMTGEQGNYTLFVTPEVPESLDSHPDSDYNKRKEELFDLNEEALSHLWTYKTYADQQQLIENGIDWYSFNEEDQESIYIAIQLLEEAVEMAGSLNAMDLLAGALGNLSLAYLMSDQPEKANSYLENAIEIAREIENNRKLKDGVAESLFLLEWGYSYTEHGHPEEAIPLLEDAWKVLREENIGLSEESAIVQLLYANHQAGHVDRLLNLSETYLQIVREYENLQAKVEGLELVSSYYNLGVNYNDLDIVYKEILEIYQELNDRENEIDVLIRLGGLHRELGAYQNSIDFLEEALEISEIEGSEAVQSNIFSQLSLTYYALGQPEKANELSERASAISSQTTIPPEIPSHGESQGDESSLDGNANDTRVDAANQPEDSHSSETIQNTDTDSEVSTRREVSVPSEVPAQQEQELPSVEESWQEIQDQHDSLNALLLKQSIQSLEQSLFIIGDVYQIRFWENSIVYELGSDYLELYQYEPMDSHLEAAVKYLGEALDRLRQSGVRNNEGDILTKLGKAYILQGKYSEAEQKLREAISFWQSLRVENIDINNQLSLLDDQLEAYMSLQLLLWAGDRHVDALEVAESARAQALNYQLSRISPLDEASESLNISDENSLISEHEIREFARFENSTLVEYTLTPYGLILIWVVKPNGEIHLRVSDQDTINNSLARTLGLNNPLGRITDLLSTQSSGRGTSTSEDIWLGEGARDSDLRKLHRVLVEPIVDLLPKDEDDQVIFIPHQEIFRVPFAALINDQDEYLIENHTISTAPSIQSLVLTHERNMQLSGGALDKEALVVGNPTLSYSLAGAMGWEQLPGAEKEARNIALLFDEYEIPATVLYGDEATEVAITQQMKSASYIHLATHGALSATAGSLDDVSEELSSVRYDHIPGFIALASSMLLETDTPSESVDGLLTSDEIIQLALENPLNAELVVLSACQTGQGPITSDGTYGLSRSLLLAGVPSVVVSLWNVSDSATEALMVDFYTQLLQTDDKAQALRQAMLLTMEEYPDPRAWGAFVLIGQP